MAEQSRGPSFQSHERPPGPSSPSGAMDLKYDVFLMQLGRCPGEGFMSHLWDELRSVGLNPFLQEKSLAKGDDALGSVDAALAVARAHVVVVSAGCGSDPNGLRNLVTMMKSGKPLIPVRWDLYHPELLPSSIRPSYSAIGDDISPVERTMVLEKLMRMDAFLVREGNPRQEAELMCEVVNYLSDKLMPIEDKDLERILKAYPAIQDLGLDAGHRPTRNSYTTRVLGVLDTLTDNLEFYFENREHMANIVGVGLQYGKAIVKPGSCIEAVEIDEYQWEYMWNHRARIGTRFSRVKVFHVTLPVTVRGQVYENRGHEDCSDLGTSISNDGTFQEHALGISYRQVQGPFLWELSKYFIVKNVMDGFYVARGIPTLGESFASGGPSETGGVTRGGMGNGSLKERLSSLSVDSKSNQGKQGGNGDGGNGGNDGDDSDGDDSDGDDNRDGPGKGKNVSRERKVISTKVLISLRSGGDFFDKETQLLPVICDQFIDSNLVIEPFLSLDFQKTREETGEVDKEILCAVGPVTFCLPPELVYFESDGRFGWFHDELRVSFGPKSEGDAEVRLLKESEAEDCMDGKITNKASSSKEAGSSHEGGVKGKLVVGNNNIARGEVGGDCRKGTRDSHSQSNEQSFESPWKQTEGGFHFLRTRMPRKGKVEYCYTAPSSQIILDNIKDPSYREWLSRHSPLCREQRTKYSCGWCVRGDADNLTYYFKAERKLRMLKSEAVEEKSEAVEEKSDPVEEKSEPVEMKSERSPTVLSSFRKKMKMKRKMPQESAPVHIDLEQKSAPVQESAPMSQRYEKDILINLAMTHLVDGKTFKLDHGGKQPNWGGGVPLANIIDPPIEL